MPGAPTQGSVGKISLACLVADFSLTEFRIQLFAPNFLSCSSILVVSDSRQLTLRILLCFVALGLTVLHTAPNLSFLLRTFVSFASILVDISAKRKPID